MINVIGPNDGEKICDMLERSQDNLATNNAGILPFSPARTFR